MNHDQEYLKHITLEITPEIQEYATDEVFLRSRYIFTYREGNSKQLFGFCTHCHHVFPIYRRPKSQRLVDILCEIECANVSYAHNSEAFCPNCGSLCIAKSCGMQRKNLIDEAYFVFYEKSLIDPDAMVARGIHAVRNYSGNYKNVKTQYYTKSLYIFQMGQSQMYRRDWTYNDKKELIHFYRKCSSVYQLFKDQWNFDEVGYQTWIYQKIIPVSVSLASIEDAVQGTPFQYSTWADYAWNSDMVKFFDLYSRYPCIEYLTKMGFGNLMEQKLAGYYTYHTINWNGKNPLKVLKLTKQEIREIQNSEVEITFKFLKLLKDFKKNGISLTMQEISEISLASYYEEPYKDAFESILEYTSVRQANKYLKQQVAKKYFQQHTQALIAWRDYIADCIKLEMELTQESVLFPRNLYQAHQNTIEQVTIKADRELDKMIKAMLKGLNKKYCYEYDGLFIRPAQGTEELINEGKALNHCVGGYAKRYEKGETVILLLRKELEPMKPYYTVEIKGKTVIQCRGKNNCAPDQAVNEFIEAFKQKLAGKIHKNRIRITVPA